ELRGTAFRGRVADRRGKLNGRSQQDIGVRKPSHRKHNAPLCPDATRGGRAIVVDRPRYGDHNWALRGVISRATRGGPWMPSARTASSQTPGRRPASRGRWSAPPAGRRTAPTRTPPEPGTRKPPPPTPYPSRPSPPSPTTPP